MGWHFRIPDKWSNRKRAPITGSRGLGRINRITITNSKEGIPLKVGCWNFLDDRDPTPLKTRPKFHPKQGSSKGSRYIVYTGMLPHLVPAAGAGFLGILPSQTCHKSWSPTVTKGCTSQSIDQLMCKSTHVIFFGNKKTSYLEPFDDPCFGWKRTLFLEGSTPKNRGRWGPRLQFLENISPMKKSARLVDPKWWPDCGPGSFPPKWCINSCKFTSNVGNLPP